MPWRLGCRRARQQCTDGCGTQARWSLQVFRSNTGPPSCVSQCCKEAHSNLHRVSSRESGSGCRSSWLGPPSVCRFQVRVYPQCEHWLCACGAHEVGQKRLSWRAWHEELHAHAAHLLHCCLHGVSVVSRWCFLFALSALACAHGLACIVLLHDPTVGKVDLVLHPAAALLRGGSMHVPATTEFVSMSLWTWLCDDPACAFALISDRPALETGCILGSDKFCSEIF